MTTLIGIAVMILLVMLQTTVVRSLPLLQGTADLVLLVVAAWSLQGKGNAPITWAIIGGLLVGLVSKVPWFVPLVAYVGIAILAQTLRRQVWQTPILAMFFTTLAGSLVYFAMQWIALQVQGISLPAGDSLNLVVFPGTLLNLILALPVYALVTDITQSVYLEEGTV